MTPALGLRQIHDTAAFGSGAPSYAREPFVDAPPFSVYDALTTLEGIAGWWTGHVEGVPTGGGQLRLAFPGVVEHIIVRVVETSQDAAVTWNCIVHSGHAEWAGTTIRFELEEDEAGATLLRFRHDGLVPQLECYDVCERGWDHFLVSLSNYAATGRGTPFGTQPLDPVRAERAAAPPTA